jgi:hypothetical protein
MGVLNSTIPSAVSDTGATSSAFLKEEDPSIPTGRTSSAIFHLPNGAVAPATTINKLLHNVRAPAWDVNIVLFYYRVEPYKHNSYMVIDNHTEI